MRKIVADAFESRLPELAGVLVERAAAGDMTAMKMCLNYCVGRPIRMSDDAEAAIRDRVSELIQIADAIEPRPDLKRPDLQLIQDAATLAELALPPDAWADALAIDREKFAAWFSAGEKKPDSICGRLVRAVRVASARAQLRLAIRAEHAPLGVLERRDPDNFGRTEARRIEADPDQFDEADVYA
ncbi:MAG: hypothetical protein AAGJ38_07545 [Planctomycetota bacterium]